MIIEVARVHLQSLTTKIDVCGVTEISASNATRQRLTWILMAICLGSAILCLIGALSPAIAGDTERNILFIAALSLPVVGMWINAKLRHEYQNRRNDKRLSPVGLVFQETSKLTISWQDVAAIELIKPRGIEPSIFDGISAGHFIEIAVVAEKLGMLPLQNWAPPVWRLDFTLSKTRTRKVACQLFAQSSNDIIDVMLAYWTTYSNR